MKKNFLPQMPAVDLARFRASVPALHLPRLTSTSSLPARRRGDTGPADRLALTEIRSHLTYTAGTVTAWYVLPEAVWPFRSDASRETQLTAIATQYAGLEGLDLHVRRTSVPFAVRAWAKAMHRNSRPLPDDPDSIYPSKPMGPGHVHVQPTWRNHLRNAIASLDEGAYHYGRTYLGVTMPRPSRMMSAVARTGGADQAIAKRVAQITEDLSVPGLAARPASPDELAWLIFRSVGLGLTPPPHRAGDRDAQDIPEYIDRIEFARGRYAATTQVTDRTTGETSYVAVLSVGRMEPIEVPQVHQPWAHLSEQVDYPVEWSSRVRILGAAASRGSLEHRLMMIQSQRRDYADHNIPEPPELARLAGRASDVGDEVSTGLPVDSSRAHGWHRLAVTGATEDEALERARDLARTYDQQLHMTLAHPKNQWHLFREFTPGEPVADTGYLRRMPVRLLAAAMPQAAAGVGDNRGDLIGHTATSGCRPVFWDPHFPMEVRERSGLAVFASEPGGGKSTLLGALGYLNARRGAQVTLMDPSGPLAELCQMPELRRYSKVIDLISSPRGTLAPYALIPTPRRADYASNSAYDNAVATAESERSALALDLVQMLLPPQVLADSEVIVAIRDALRFVPPVESSQLDDVVAQLEEMGSAAARTAAGLLHDAARLPLAKLFFGTPPDGVLDSDAALTVITMGGLQLPDMTMERQYWSSEESLAVPMLHTAHRLAVRRSYGGAKNRRKFVGLDEAHFMNGWGSGRAFLVRLARDSRKWNIAALVASQNPQDILDFDLQNLVSTVFVGRIAEDEQIAAQALRMLRVPTGAGYEEVLAGLSQYADTSSQDRLGFREFIMRDVDGRVQKIRVDFSYVPGLLEALDTTPGGTK